MTTAVDHRPWHRFWPKHVPLWLDTPALPAWWILERNLPKHERRVAVRHLDYRTGEVLSELSYGDLYRQARALAGGLAALGIRRGDRIAICLPNSPQLIVSYFGIWLAGAVAVPCHALSRGPELRYQLADSQARLLICAGQTWPAAAEAAAGYPIDLAVDAEDQAGFAGAMPLGNLIEAGAKPPDTAIDPDEDLALILYTGGTTGVPKGAMLTHANVVVNTVQFGTWYAFEDGRETCISALPLSHSGGLAGALNVPLFHGATLLLLERFNPLTVVTAVERFRATRCFGVPTMYIAILNHPACRTQDLSSLRPCRTNAAPLPAAVKAAFDERVGHEVLVEGYGLSEASPLTHANPIDRPKAGSIGIPLAGTDARIVDLETGDDLPAGASGELLVRGPQVMKGYWSRPDETQEALTAGWLRTGDIARVDEDGYFAIVDRKKDLINTGGFKVWPREVEEALYTHPAIRLAAAVGVPDDYWGEIVQACVVLKDCLASSPTAEAVQAFCKERLASYKVPKVVEFRAELPISPNGKVLRRLLREQSDTANQARSRPSVNP